MGNHMVGQIYSAAAKGFWFGNVDPSMEDALEFLDMIGEEWEGADAEFDDELMDGESTDLGRLVALAMEATPEELESEEDEDGYNPWYEGPVTRFYERYHFS